MTPWTATADTLESGENTGVRVVVTDGVDGGVIGESTSQTIMDAYAYVQSLAAPTHPERSDHDLCRLERFPL